MNNPFPARERWLHDNPDAMAAVREGIAQAKAGEFVEGPPMTLVALVESTSRESIIATLRDMARDIERGLSNAGGGGVGEPQAMMDWQINYGNHLDSIRDSMVDWYDRNPAVRAVTNHPEHREVSAHE